MENLRNYLSLVNNRVCEYAISLMTKIEIRDALKAAGVFDKTGTRNDLWNEAFKLYHQETRMKLCTSCGASYNRLRSWMNS